MSQILPYHIIKEICEEHQIKVTLMTGSKPEYTTFFMEKPPYDTKVYGSCMGPKVIFNIAGNRQNYDLADPNSILQMSEYLSSRIWRVWDLGDAHVMDDLDDHFRSGC